jgi:heparan-alpha-glucosaminide N-acetyltransferase
MTSQTSRLASIDVFRAVTMLMMIFVNDLWTLRDIPAWLEHTAAHDDGMGLADTVFPAFLFIVGLSIPFAIGGRLAKGASTPNILGHIIVRTIALLVMGFFHVNLESYHTEAALLPKPIWEILITIGFFLVWLDYSPRLSKQKKQWLQGLGIALLIAMAALFKGKDDGQTVWMKPYWWGILGLIGWTYLLAALAYLFTKGRLPLLIAAWICFLVLNIAENAGWLRVLKPIGGSSGPALALAGIVAAATYSWLSAKAKHLQYTIILLLFAGSMFAIGFALRPYWGISKIMATPAWVMICSGISILFFLFFIWLVDRKKKENWFAFIRPAGTSTLTAYLLPYIHYSLYSMIGISLPLILRTGMIGIIKCLLYAVVIILITGLLEKKRLRLKL